MEQIWSTHIAYRERIMVLLRKIFGSILAEPQKETHRRLLKRSIFPQLLEVQGVLPLLLQLGFEDRTTSIIFPMENNLEPIQAAMMEIKTRTDSNIAERARNRQKNIEIIAKSKQKKDAGMLRKQLQLEMEKMYSNKKTLMNLRKKSGQGLRIEWSIRDWGVKDCDPQHEFPSHPSVLDMAGRKWKGYVKKYYSKHGDKIGIFLHCLSIKSTDSPVIVAMRADVLHRNSKVPCDRIGIESEYYEMKEFSYENDTWGWQSFSSTNEFTTMGAFAKNEDIITIRIDFSIKEGTNTHSTEENISMNEKKQEKTKSNTVNISNDGHNQKSTSDGLRKRREKIQDN